MEVGDALADDVVQRDEAPCAPIASRIAAESSCAFANSGPTSSSGRSQSVSWCSRGTSSEWPGNSGRWSRKASETLVLEDDVAGLVAGDDRAEAAVVGHGRDSGNDRQRAGLDAELELAVVADVVAVDLDREAARMRPSASRETDSIRRLGDALEVVDLAVVAGCAGARAARAPRSSACRAGRRGCSIATESVPLSSAAPSQTRTGWLPK